MLLDGKELKKVRDALYEAFPSPGQMRLCVADADIGTSFDDVAFNARTYEEGIHNLLVWTVGQYRLVKLLETAVKKASDNPELKEVSAFIDEYFRVLPQFLPGKNEEERKTALGQAERVLFANVGFQNIRPWIASLEALRHRVCRIEPQPRSEGLGGYGTGFLIAPDVVITNDHIASGDERTPGFWADPDHAAKVVCRFDCEYGDDGKETTGRPHHLATDYQILRSPLAQLDFALLKLATKAGDDLVGTTSRGFVTPVSHTFTGREPLFILQHPRAEPLKLAFGGVSPRETWPPDRIAYEVNTDVGSSGSPCATQSLEIAALHHWGAHPQNSAVLISAILAFLRKSEHADKLKAAGLVYLLNGTPEGIPDSPLPRAVPSWRVRLVIRGQLRDFGDQERSSFLDALIALAGLKGPVEVEEWAEGSILLVVLVGTLKDAQRILAAFERGDLASQGVTGVSAPEGTDPPVPGPPPPPPRQVTAMTGKQKGELVSAILAAYTRQELIDFMALKMNVTLGTVIPLDGTDQSVALRLIEWFLRNGPLDSFLDELVKDKPTHTRLLSVIAAIRSV